MKSPLSEKRIRLPRFAFEPNLDSLILLLSQGDGFEVVTLDFAAVQNYIPAATVAIIAKIKFWESQGVLWRFDNFQENPVSRYFQRMDFCTILGWDVPENFNRRPAGAAFVPIEQVPATDQDVAPIANKLANCIDPEGGEPFQLMQFCNGEAILNARQHSGGLGFVSAQYYPAKEIVRIGVADCGIGVLESFRQNESPFYQDGMSDNDALCLAIRPEVSSTIHLRTPYGRSPNRGVGLSMMRQLMSQTLGYMALISGKAWWYQEAKKAPTIRPFGGGASFQGTILAVAFRRDQIDDYPRMLAEAREGLGLQVGGDVGSMFA